MTWSCHYFEREREREINVVIILLWQNNNPKRLVWITGSRTTHVKILTTRLTIQYHLWCWWRRRRGKYTGAVMRSCIGFRRRQFRRPNSSRFIWLHLHFSSEMLSGSYFNGARLTITAVKRKHDADACAWMIYLQHHSKNYNYKH